MVKRPRKPTAPLLTDDAVPLKSGRVRKRDPEQPELPFDPMPERIEPCLAKLVAKPPRGDEWSYELKWDGYRLAVHIETNRVRIITRGGHDWTHRFPGIEAAARRFMPNTMILDGEAVVLNEQGVPDFGRLQNSLGGRGGKLPAGNAILFAFDLLYLGGHDLTKMEYSARRHLLEDVLADSPGSIRVSEEFDEDPDEMLRHACAHDLEGIIAKHRDRPYRSGRTGDWLKIKCVQSDTFAIVGYEPSTALPGAIASLLLAARYRDGWKYVGSVGTGFKHDEARRLKKQLDKIKTSVPVVSVPGKSLVMTGPSFAAEIEYRAWTHTGTLRHPSFKGLREAEDWAEIYRLPD
ncbi:bifunctional non-homologous end joining protein LigD [Pseudorhizobium tarimense]|uniref:DNA ligase (ATP) n=1 Tax=Pseudorhizobium tarimense TaxID=1079109 RepID=A0ABV2H9Z5_9HYPH|nr:non-homologous end-joining DNA ligase [Pseudorhizobium tarimense]MCJ8520621.1 non-homologous end-joining DNA ligase [Pseudorhizobium tarimense]